MKKYSAAFISVLWMMIILTMFFVVQKPDFLKVLAGIRNLILVILIPFWMAALSACLGIYLLPDSDATERIIFGTAIGMTFFGLAGFGLAITGLAKPLILLTLLASLTGYFALAGKISQVEKDARLVAGEIYESAKSVACWIPISADRVRSWIFDEPHAAYRRF